MYRPGTDPDAVTMDDVLCDFCHAAWREDVPFIEGHRGAVICGDCLTRAFVEIEGDGPQVVRGGFTCRMSRESDEDRAALRRAGEAGSRSPVDPEAVVCRKVIRMAAATLAKDPDHDWSKPARPDAPADPPAPDPAGDGSTAP